MELYLNFEYREEDLSAFPLHDLAMFCLERLEVPSSTEVSITFVDDDEMASLNESYRRKKGPTDVLSFECDGIDDEYDFSLPDDFSGEFDDVFELGDIIIAPDVAERQALDFGTTFEGELALLLVHGLLHLCGFDHIEDDEAALMKEKERALLSAWHEERGGDATAVETLIFHEHPRHRGEDD